MRLDKLSFVERRERRATEDSSFRRIMRSQYKNGQLNIDIPKDGLSS